MRHSMNATAPTRRSKRQRGSRLPFGFLPRTIAATWLIRSATRLACAIAPWLRDAEDRNDRGQDTH